MTRKKNICCQQWPIHTQKSGYLFEWKMGMDFSYTPKAKTDFNRSIYDIDKLQKNFQCSVILTVDEKFKSNKVFAKSLSGTATLQSPYT